MRRGAPYCHATTRNLRNYSRLTTSTPPLLRLGWPWLLRDHREFLHGEQARTGVLFTSYVETGKKWSTCFHHLATVTSRHAHHGDTEGTEISQRRQGSPCISVYSVSPW